MLIVDCEDSLWLTIVSHAIVNLFQTFKTLEENT